MSLFVSGYRLPNLVDRTIVGTGIDRPPTDPYTSNYVAVPDVEKRAILESEQMLRDLRGWTGWSDRTLVEIIGTTHPTVAKLNAGESEFLARNETNRRRLAEAYQVAGRDTRRTASILEQMSFGDRSARQYLCEGRPNEAYLAVVEALHPARRDGMMRGAHPIDPRTATVAPADED